jgi:3-hydroxybutyryl-CoA dehydratase
MEILIRQRKQAIRQESDQPLTVDKKTNEKHCSTRQSSGRLSAAADVYVMFNRDHEIGVSKMINSRERAAEGLQVGDSFRTSRTFSNDDLIRFADISRDYNPVHFDVRFAKARNLHAPICHGLLAASLVTELGGQIAWLATSMNFRFKAPVFVGDTVTCTWDITAMDENGRACASATLVKQDGVTVIEAEISGIAPGDAERKILTHMLSEGDPTNKLTAMP